MIRELTNINLNSENVFFVGDSIVCVFVVGFLPFLSILLIKKLRLKIIQEQI